MKRRPHGQRKIVFAEAPSDYRSSEVLAKRESIVFSNPDTVSKPRIISGMEKVEVVYASAVPDVNQARAGPHIGGKAMIFKVLYERIAAMPHS